MDDGADSPSGSTDRRPDRTSADPARPDDGRIRLGELVIDLSGRQVAIGGRPVELTLKEFDLLAFLAARPGHCFDRDQLLRRVWGSTSQWQQPATVTEHIRRLRAKIERDARHPLLLQTVRGAGYRLDPPSSDRR